MGTACLRQEHPKLRPVPRADTESFLGRNAASARGKGKFTSSNAPHRDVTPRAQMHSKGSFEILFHRGAPRTADRDLPGGKSMEQQRVAVVIEDNADIRSLLGDVLDQAGFQVFSAATGLEGVELARKHEPLVTTLDVSMPGMDGFETARRIRGFSNTYLVMLTARNDEIDTLQGLEAGADDYITKPFRPRELRARIDAMLRRPRVHSLAATTGELTPPGDVAAQSLRDPGAHSRDTPIEFGTDEGQSWLSHKGLRMHPRKRLIEIDGEELAVELTRSEFDILRELLESGRLVLSKHDLALMLRGEQHIGSDYLGESEARAIEVHMANLRRKLRESATMPRWIETVRGVGYRLTSP